MITLRNCDICKSPIMDFNKLRELSLIKRKSEDCIVDVTWEYDLCLNCSQIIEKEIIRMKKIADNRGKTK